MKSNKELFKILRDELLSDEEARFRFEERLMKPMQPNQSAVFPRIDPGVPEGDTTVVQGWKVVPNKTTFAIDRERLEREIKFDGYRSNNDRRAHGKHVLRHREIEKCRQKNPELTLEARIGKRFQERLNRELERSLFGSRTELYYNHNVRPKMVLDAYSINKLVSEIGKKEDKNYV